LTSSALAAQPDLLGEQRPRVLNLPERGSDELSELALRTVYAAGMRLKPWQEWDLHESLLIRPDGLWCSPDCGLVVSRQNGKGEVIIARQAVGLYLLDEALQVYTSHKFTTTMEMFRRLKSVITGYEPFASRIQAIRVANGDVGVELKSGGRVRFLARTADSGRGFANVSTLYLDEAMSLTESELEALLPTTTAAQNPQIWWVGSAGIGEPSRVFARVRRRGLTGKDDRLLWAEWSISDDADPDDVTTWGAANPGLGLGQVTMRTLHGYRDNMNPEGFAREYLGRGDWPDDSDGNGGAISRDQWGRAADLRSKVLDPVVFAVAVALDGSRAAIGVAGRRKDGLTHVEIVEHQPGTHWVPARITELVGKHAGSLAVLDGGTRANQLVPAIIEAGLPVHSGKSDRPAGSLVLLSGQDVAAAFGSFVSSVTEEPPTLRHLPHAGLNDAVSVATTRHVGQALAWDGKNLADISPLVAVTLAAHGYAKYGSTANYDPLDSVL
jgi:hypothetical protein